MAAARLSRALAGGLLAAASAVAAAEPPTIRWTPLGDGGREGELRVEGLPAERLARLGDGELAPELGERLLRVVAAPAGGDGDGLPNLWGSYRLDAEALVFRPRHALGPGVDLLARFDGAAFDRATGLAGTPSRDLRVAMSASEEPLAEVVSVAPSGEELPANLLRLYVEFSGPMSLAGVERHVALLDGDGDEIAGPFVEMPNGLWDFERRRLTLLVHPGRVKRGVAANEALGSPLVEGERVTLVVRPEARDADGRPVAAAFARTYRVGPPLRSAIDPAAWTLIAPAAPDAPLAIAFDRPLDRALAERAFAVIDEAGEPVVVRIAIETGERRAELHPATPWRDGASYRLRVDPVLEDVAGNRLGLPFERPPGETREPAPSALGFVVRIAAPGGDAAP